MSSCYRVVCAIDTLCYFLSRHRAAPSIQTLTTARMEGVVHQDARAQPVPVRAELELFLSRPDQSVILAGTQPFLTLSCPSLSYLALHRLALLCVALPCVALPCLAVIRAVSILSRPRSPFL